MKLAVFYEGNERIAVPPDKFVLGHNTEDQVILTPTDPSDVNRAWYLDCSFDEALEILNEALK